MPILFILTILGTQFLMNVQNGCERHFELIIGCWCLHMLATLDCNHGSMKSPDMSKDPSEDECLSAFLCLYFLTCMFQACRIDCVWIERAVMFPYVLWYVQVTDPETRHYSHLELLKVKHVNLNLFRRGHTEEIENCWKLHLASLP